MSKVLDSLRKDIEVRIDAYNKALVKNDFGKMNQIEVELREAEGAYAEQQMREVFGECKKTENPILEAVKRYSYPIITHHVMREEGRVTGIELVDNRTKQIDLVKLCKSCDMTHLWEYKVEKFGNLLCMRAAKELGLSDADTKKIERLYYCNALSRSEEMGAIPTSNTQIVKLLQQVIDAVLYVEGDGGKNVYRANSRDVAYLLMAYTKRNGRKALTIEVAKNSYVHRLVMDVMHRIVTGKVYDLKYQMVKEEKSADKKPDEPTKVKDAVETSDTVKIPRPVKSKTPEATEHEDSEPEDFPSFNEITEADLNAFTA